MSRWVWPWLVGCGCGWTSAPPATHDPLPAVLWVTLEGVSADAPPLAPLRERGISWERAYLPSPLLQPNLATLFTGALPRAHGVWTDGHHRLAPRHQTLAEEVAASDWETAASTGTHRTRAGWGLHQGFDVRFDHDDPTLSTLPGEEVVGRLDLSSEPLLAWVHLEADALSVLPGLAQRFLEAHPAGSVVVVGVEGENPGLLLHDDALHVPMILIGPGAPPGARRDEVVGLPEVYAEVRAIAGLPLHTTPTLRGGGSGAVIHESRVGQLVFGAAPLRGVTVPEGRLVDDVDDRWFPAQGTHISRHGQPASDQHPHHRHLEEAARAPIESSPRVFSEPSVLRALARESIWVLGDPDAPSGPRSPTRLAGATEALIRGWRGVEQGRTAVALEACHEPGLRGTPADIWLSALAWRRRGDLDEAALAFERGQQRSGGALFALQRAYIELDRFERSAAIAWAERAVALGADHADLRAAALSVTAIARLPIGPLPPPVDDRMMARSEWGLLLWNSEPDYDRLATVLTLGDPIRFMAMPDTAHAWARRPDLAETGLARSLALWHVGQTNEAVDVLRSVVARDPIAAVPRALLAHWDLELGHDEEAVRLLAPLARARPDDDAFQAWFQAARAAHTWEERQERKVDRAFHRP